MGSAERQDLPGQPLVLGLDKRSRDALELQSQQGTAGPDTVDLAVSQDGDTQEQGSIQLVREGFKLQSQRIREMCSGPSP